MELKRSLTVKRGFEHLNCAITSRTRRDVVCYKRLCSRLGEMRPSYASLCSVYAYLFCCCCFSGNVTNIPAVLQPSSTCQWGRYVDSLLSTLHASANRIFLGSGYAISLSFFFIGLSPSFLASRGLAAQRSRARALPLLG